MKTLTKALLMTLLLGAAIGYKVMDRLQVDPENVIITGSCSNLETEEPVVMVKDQLMVMTLHPDKIEGVIRKTGEQVICPRNMVVKEFGKYRNYPKFLQPEEEPLVPLVQLKVEENGIKDLKNTNILVSGTCKEGEKSIVLNQEPATVLDTKRIKGKYFLDLFLYATSKELVCLLTDISVAAASDYQIEKAKLKVMNPDQLLGRTILLTGICRPEAANDPTYMNLINARAKIIDIELKDGRPVRLRAGVESKGKIVNCGDNNGKFVLEPYIYTNTSSEE